MAEKREPRPTGSGPSRSRRRRNFDPEEALALGVNPDEYNPSDWVTCTSPGNDGETCGAKRRKEWLERQPCAACGTWWNDLVAAPKPKAEPVSEPEPATVRVAETKKVAAANVRSLFLGL